VNLDNRPTLQIDKHLIFYIGSCFPVRFQKKCLTRLKYMLKRDFPIVRIFFSVKSYLYFFLIKSILMWPFFGSNTAYCRNSTRAFSSFCRISVMQIITMIILRILSHIKTRLSVRIIGLFTFIKMCLVWKHTGTCWRSSWNLKIR